MSASFGKTYAAYNQTLRHLAPYATQAVTSGNPRLLSAVLHATGLPLEAWGEAARSMVAVFSVVRGLFQTPSFLPVMTMEEVEAILRDVHVPAIENSLYEGGKTYTGAIKFPGPAVRVYSNGALASANEIDPRVCQMNGDFFSITHRETIVDLRDIRFCHSLSEGKASRLVQEKMLRMRHQLSSLGLSLEGISYGDSERMIEMLTSGDKNSEEDRIRVARYRDEPCAFLLNGHRRLTTLCLLALQGDIPLRWLRRIPVWEHEIVSRECIPIITAGTTLDSHEVLSEVSLDGHCAAEALDLLKFLPREEIPKTEDAMERLFFDEPYKEMISKIVYPHDAHWHLIMDFLSFSDGYRNNPEAFISSLEQLMTLVHFDRKDPHAVGIFCHGLSLGMDKRVIFNDGSKGSIDDIKNLHESCDAGVPFSGHIGPAISHWLVKVLNRASQEYPEAIEVIVAYLSIICGNSNENSRQCLKDILDQSVIEPPTKYRSNAEFDRALRIFKRLRQTHRSAIY